MPWALAFAALAFIPIRLPVDVGDEEANLLLPLYGVIGAYALAFGWQLLRGDERVRELGGPLAWSLAAVVAITATAAVATLALPWGAARDTEIAAENWPADPDAAFERLDRARGLNPLDDTPDAVAGTIALRLGDGERALTYFEEAAERNPHNWYSQLMLGSLAATRGDRAEALRFLRSASELNPDDQLIRDAIAGARRGTALRPAAIDRELQLRVCARVGRTSATPECE